MNIHVEDEQNLLDVSQDGESGVIFGDDCWGRRQVGKIDVIFGDDRGDRCLSVYVTMWRFQEHMEWFSVHETLH